MNNIHKTKKGIELVYTLSLSKVATRSCVVLLPGIPYNPQKETFLKEKLTSHHDVFIIHYDGTWGSSGNFLEQNPTISVNDFIESIAQGVILNASDEVYESVFIIGTSFGGGLALTLKNNPILKAVCALSPVISYKSVSGIETLGAHLKDKYSENYTFELDDMQALVNDQIISLEKQITLPKEKLLVFAGELDDQVLVNDVSKFCLNHNIILNILPMSHITLSKVDLGIYQEIATFFDSKIIK